MNPSSPLVSPFGPTRTAIERPLAWLAAVLLLACCSRPDAAERRVAPSTPAAPSRPSRPVMKESSPSASHRPPSNTAPEATETTESLVRAIANARQGGKTVVDYRAPNPDEYAHHVVWLRTLFAAPATPAPTVPAGFLLRELGDEYRYFEEEPTQKRGAGVVVLRKGTSRPLAIEVPHSFFDEGTLELGLALYLRSSAALLLVNTVHRYRTTDGKPPGGGDAPDTGSSSKGGPRHATSDVAHTSASYFNAAHEAFSFTHPQSLAIQLHGYSDDSAPDFDLVISAARTKSQLAQLATALRHALGLRVALYPEDIRKLGGTTNVQALLSRKHGTCFVHLELAQSLRSRLHADSALLSRFSDLVLAEAHCP